MMIVVDDDEEEEEEEEDEDDDVETQVLNSYVESRPHALCQIPVFLHHEAPKAPQYTVNLHMTIPQKACCYTHITCHVGWTMLGRKPFSFYNRYSEGDRNLRRAPINVSMDPRFYAGPL